MSKSQPLSWLIKLQKCCHFYHKGNEFWANHNKWRSMQYFLWVVISTTKVMNFEQITTICSIISAKTRCHFYHKGNEFWANHNQLVTLYLCNLVVISTTKVMNFEQITTPDFFDAMAQKVVISTTKVMNFEQITTDFNSSSLASTLSFLPQR